MSNVTILVLWWPAVFLLWMIYGELKLIVKIMDRHTGYKP